MARGTPRSPHLQALADEIMAADQQTVLAGAHNMLAYLAEVIMDRMGVPYAGSVDVRYEAHDRTVLTITWNHDD